MARDRRSITYDWDYLILYERRKGNYVEEGGSVELDFHELVSEGAWVVRGCFEWRGKEKRMAYGDE